MTFVKDSELDLAYLSNLLDMIKDRMEEVNKLNSLARGILEARKK